MKLQGGTLLIHAHRAIESVTLDKETMHKKDNDYAKICRTYL